MGVLPLPSLGPEFHSMCSTGNPERKNLINEVDHQVQWKKKSLKISSVASIMEIVTWIT